MSVLPENKIIINAKTAKELGLKNDDLVKIVSPANPEGIWDLKNGEVIPVQGKIHIKQGIRPGVVSVSWYYGHWAYGGNDVVVDGELIKGEKLRRGGLCPNSVMENVSLENLIGGSASYYDSKVNLVKL